jgi:hypothetical protein
MKYNLTYFLEDECFRFGNSFYGYGKTVNLFYDDENEVALPSKRAFMYSLMCPDEFNIVEFQIKAEEDITINALYIDFDEFDGILCSLIL